MRQQYEQDPRERFSLKRFINNVGRLIHREKSPADTAECVESPDGRAMNFFPHANDGIFGRDGYDLANAHYKEIVLAGDILRVNLPPEDEHSQADGIQVRDVSVIYYRPSHFIFGGPQGRHHLLPLPENPRKKSYITNPSSWEKTGTASSQDLQRAIEKAYGQEEVGYDVLRKMGAFDEDPTG